MVLAAKPHAKSVISDNRQYALIRSSTLIRAPLRTASHHPRILAHRQCRLSSAGLSSRTAHPTSPLVASGRHIYPAPPHLAPPQQHNPRSALPPLRPPALPPCRRPAVPPCRCAAVPPCDRSLLIPVISIITHYRSRTSGLRGSERRRRTTRVAPSPPRGHCC